MATFLLGSLLIVLTYVWTKSPDRWAGWAIVTGLLGGLTVLARIDSVVVVLCVLGVVALLGRDSTRWRAPALSLATVAVIVAPWFVWSYAATGHALPVSGEAATWLTREHYLSGNPNPSLADQLRESRDYMELVFRVRIPDLYGGARWLMLVSTVAVLALVGHFALFASKELRAKAMRWLLVAGPPIAGFTALLVYHTGYRWFFREWYFAWGMPLMALLAGVLFAYACEAAADALSRLTGVTWASRRAVGSGLLVISAVLFAAGYAVAARDIWQPSFLGPQRDNLAAGLYLKRHTPPDARAAAFNSGIVGYFSERQVFNIDGVVNPDAFEAMQENRLLPYLRSRDVVYVADRDGAWFLLPAFIRPDDWSESLWGEDPNAAMVREAEIAPRFGVFGQMTVFRIVR
jgi:hypothetical protein